MDTSKKLRIDIDTGPQREFKINKRSAYASRWTSSIGVTLPHQYRPAHKYRERVRKMAADLGSDGCTGVPEFYRDG